MGNKASKQVLAVGVTTTETAPVKKRTALKSSQSTKKLLLPQIKTKPLSPPYNGDNLAGRAAMAWVSAKNRHDVMSLYSIATSDCIFHFVDSDVAMPTRAFAERMLAMYDAFPNLQFQYDRLDIIGPHTVVLVNYFGKGTHTGTSYEFTPSCPAVPPATGFEIADEPIDITFRVNDVGKIIDCCCDAHGKVVGPPGFYLKLSDKLAQQKKSQQKKKLSRKP
jgi:predicted ester cyclase